MSPCPIDSANDIARRSVPARQDDDVGIGGRPSTSVLRQTPVIPQTPLVSGEDRARLAGESSARKSHRNTASGAAPKSMDAAHAKQNSWASRLSLDWTRRDGSRSGAASFLPLGLFSSFGQDGTVGNGRYEPVAPMKARNRQQSYVELDMDDFAEGLRLSAAGEADDDEDQRKYYALREREERRKRMRRKSSPRIGAFVSPACESVPCRR